MDECRPNYALKILVIFLCNTELGRRRKRNNFMHTYFIYTMTLFRRYESIMKHVVKERTAKAKCTNCLMDAQRTDIQVGKNVLLPLQKCLCFCYNLFSVQMQYCHNMSHIVLHMKRDSVFQGIRLCSIFLMTDYRSASNSVAHFSE
jgi:hypothetical protein